MTRKRAPLDGSYQHLNEAVVAALQGREDLESATRLILATHSPEQIRAVLYDEGERYRRFSHERFHDLVERLRMHGVLWGTAEPSSIALRDNVPSGLGDDREGKEGLPKRRARPAEEPEVEAAKAAAGSGPIRRRALDVRR